MSKQTTKTKKSESNAAIPMDSLDKIDRIRDLIIGPHLRDITQRFSTISKDITRLEGELTRVTDELKEQSSTIKKNVQEMEKRLTDQFKESRASQDEEIGQIEQRISGQVQEFEKQFATRIQDIIQDLREVELANRTELRQTVEEMNQAKMDRFSLGELFSQLGDGLKTSKPEDEISQLLSELQKEIE